MRKVAVFLLAVVGSCSAPSTDAARPQPADDTAARVERVLNGLRPRMEIEGAPVRWSLAERMAAHQVPAVSIAIIDRGRIVWAQGFGVREAGGRDPVTGTTLFQAASSSKPIAVSAMLRLVEKGTLSLDADVNRYLTSWKLPENDFTRQEPVTLRRLATHTGGTTVGGFRGYPQGAARPTVPDLLEGKAPANSVAVRVDMLPGKKFRYSGGGTTILQQLLIDATGLPFETLLQQEVLGPVGMSRSRFEQPLADARAAEAAHGHEQNAPVPGGWHVYPELAAAGLWTTPTDLAAWAVAMADALAGRSTVLMSKATAEQIIASAVPGRFAEERVGLGLFLTGSGDRFAFGHTGQNEGFLNEFKMYPGSGQGAVVMLNVGESGVRLMREIQYAIAAEFGWPEVGTTRIKPVAVDAESLDRFAGTYALELKSGARRFPRVVKEGTRLFLEGWGPARNELYPQSPTAFIGADGVKISFSRDAEGRDVLSLGGALSGLKQ